VAAVSFSAGRDIDDKGGDKSSTKAYEDMVEIEKMLEGTTRGDPLAMDPGEKLENLQPGILASWHTHAFSVFSSVLAQHAFL
jgi:hypothetical protein